MEFSIILLKTHFSSLMFLHCLIYLPIPNRNTSSNCNSYWDTDKTSCKISIGCALLFFVRFQCTKISLICSSLLIRRRPLPRQWLVKDPLWYLQRFCRRLNLQTFCKHVWCSMWFLFSFFRDMIWQFNRSFCLYEIQTNLPAHIESKYTSKWVHECIINE